MARLRSVLALAAALACGAVLAHGQSKRSVDLGAGKLLVSARDLTDPNFAQSVVLLIQYDKQGTVGLMINRRTKVPLSKVLTDTDAAKHASDPVYLGGPVDSSAMLGLFRSSKKPEDSASPLVGDVYVISTKALLTKALAAASDPVMLRLYVGYCGWAPGQLENELSLGGWWIFDGDPSLVFSPYPDALWSRLITRTEQQIASLRNQLIVSMSSGLLVPQGSSRGRKIYPNRS